MNAYTGIVPNPIRDMMTTPSMDKISGRFAIADIDDLHDDCRLLGWEFTKLEKLSDWYFDITLVRKGSRPI